MAVIVNDPDAITETPPPAPAGNPTPTPAPTPTSGGPDNVVYVRPTTSGTGDNVKVKGSAANDRVTTSDLSRDSDHVIATGAGDDVFIFRQDDNKKPELKNALVDMGAGAADQVVLANTLDDYRVTFRDNGSIKFEWIGDGTEHNTAITFVGAEIFTFRNVDNHSGSPVYYEAQSYTLAELKSAYGVA